jgi:hypothetical protein
VQGTRWLLWAMAQAQMALGTLAETKVPRLPGRDPASILSPIGDPKEEKLTSLAGDQNANAESLELRFGKRVLVTPPSARPAVAGTPPPQYRHHRPTASAGA